jgi:hypothetical protein
MNRPADYNGAIRAFVSRHSWTDEALNSRAVSDLSARFKKTGDEVRKDIRRAFFARMLPPATMMNVALSYAPLKEARKPHRQPPGDYYPAEPTRPRR